VICIVNVSAAVDKHRRTISDEIGTGTACTFKGHKLILTAEHVIRKAEPADLKFLLRVEDAIDGESNGRTGFASSVSLPIKQIVRCEEKDLAAIELRPEGPEKLSIRFCELPKKLVRNRTTRGDGGLLLIGYPSDQAFEVSELRIANAATKFMACVPTPLMGEIVSKPERSLDSSYDPDRDHYIDLCIGIMSGSRVRVCRPQVQRFRIIKQSLFHVNIRQQAQVLRCRLRLDQLHHQGSRSYRLPLRQVISGKFLHSHCAWHQLPGTTNVS
jgi:hypothetical protein